MKQQKQLKKKRIKTKEETTCDKVSMMLNFFAFFFSY